MQVEVSATDVVEKKADDRGRVTIGAGHAHETITLAILEREG